MNIQKIKIDLLKPATYNPRKNLKPDDSEYKKIKVSIQEFGYVDPVIINADMTVIGGHQRLKVLKDMGFKEIDCVVVDIDKSKEKALNVALNKISGDWDMDLLNSLLFELKSEDFNVEITGFDIGEINSILGVKTEVKEDTFDLENALNQVKEPLTKRGDVWKLGTHRLMCGDSTVIDDVNKLMSGKVADMIFTDPPYNVSYESSSGLKIQNDSMSNEKFYKFLYDAFVSMFTVTKDGGPIYICHADSEGINFRTAMKAAGWELKQCLIWVKNALVLGRQDHHWRHEPILYGWKPGKAHCWYGGRKQSTVIEDEAGISISKSKSGYEINFTTGTKNIALKVPDYEVLSASDDSITTTWYFDKPSKNGDHPTMKPLGLIGKAIINSSLSGELILDLFGGSGSTLLAAEQAERTCYTMEIDEKYCDVIIQRWESFTGGKAVKLDG